MRDHGRAPRSRRKEYRGQAREWHLDHQGREEEEKEEKQKDYYLSERSYGSFMRSFQLPEGVDEGKIEASFAKGVLTMKLPKSADAQKNEKTISIKAA